MNQCTPNAVHKSAWNLLLTRSSFRCNAKHFWERNTFRPNFQFKFMQQPPTQFMWKKIIFIFILLYSFVWFFRIKRVCKCSQFDILGNPICASIDAKSKVYEPGVSNFHSSDYIRSGTFAKIGKIFCLDKEKGFVIRWCRVLFEDNANVLNILPLWLFRNFVAFIFLLIPFSDFLRELKFRKTKSLNISTCSSETLPDYTGITPP